jgi:hypothetical protein
MQKIRWRAPPVGNPISGARARLTGMRIFMTGE